jgi:hypothetical protein
MKSKVAVPVDALIYLFMHLADAADGNERLPKHLREAYEAQMKTPEVLSFYGELVDANNKCGGCLRVHYENTVFQER